MNDLTAPDEQPSSLEPLCRLIVILSIGLMISYDAQRTHAEQAEVCQATVQELQRQEAGILPQVIRLGRYQCPSVSAELAQSLRPALCREISLHLLEHRMLTVKNRWGQSVTYDLADPAWGCTPASLPAAPLPPAPFHISQN